MKPSHSIIFVLCILVLTGCTTTPLYLLSTPEYTQELQTKLERGLDPNIADESGRSLLRHAVEEGNIASVDLLLQYGADPLRVEGNRDSALYVAILLRKSEITKLLLSAAVESDSVASSNYSLLVCAATATRSTHLLKESALDAHHMNSECADRFSPLYHVLANKDAFGLDFLLRIGVDVDAINIFNKHTALTYSISSEDYDSFNQILAVGADPNKTEKDGKTPLDFSLSIINENSKFAEIILFSGADARKLGFDSISHSLHESNIGLLTTLLDSGTKPDLHSAQGESLLFRAIANDCLSCVDALLVHDASPNPPASINNYSPLVLSISKGNVGLTRALLAVGANPNVPHDGMYAIDVAELVMLDDKYFLELIEKAAIPDRRVDGFSESVSIDSYTRYALSYLKLLSAKEYAKGKWNDSTTKSLRNFQLQMGLPVHGYPSASTINALKAAHTKEYRNQFLVSCAKGKIKSFKSALKKNPSLLQVQDINGWTCLMHAIFNGHPNTSMYLINMGADVNHMGSDGVTPLFLAVGAKMEKQSQQKLIRLLSSKGADPNQKNNKDWTAGYIASARGGWIADELNVQHITKAENMNVAVLSRRKQRRATMWRCDVEFPSEGVKTDWDKGRNIISVQVVSGVWCVLSGTTIHKRGGGQAYRVFGLENHEQIAKQIAKWQGQGYTISAVSKNENKIVFFATEPQDKVDDSFELTLVKGGEVESTVDDMWDRGLRLVSVFQFSTSYWVIHSAKFTGYKGQTWFSSDDFPSEVIMKHWNEGKEITSLTYSSITNRWFVVMSSGTGIEDQRLVVGDFKQLYSHIKDYTSQGWELSSVAGHRLN